MVVGDDVGGGDGEESLETPLSGVESRFNLTQKRRSWSWWRSVSRKAPFFSRGRFLGYIRASLTEFVNGPKPKNNR
jgi:hypothetical protein